MNEIKGLLWYILSHVTIIISILILIINPSNIVFLFVALSGIDALIGFLYYFGFIDKLRRRLGND